jgi:hypothetical protein
MATITNYTDIISLERAKIYLRIDDNLTEDDAEITSMINGAFLFIERFTNYVFKPKNITKYPECFALRVYEFPINSVAVEPISSEVRPLYTTYKLASNNPYVLNVGFEDTDLVPDDFIQAVLQMIKVWYYESEKQVNSTLIPISVMQVLDTYRRFV